MTRGARFGRWPTPQRMKSSCRMTATRQTAFGVLFGSRRTAPVRNQATRCEPVVKRRSWAYLVRAKVRGVAISSHYRKEPLVGVDDYMDSEAGVVAAATAAAVSPRARELFRRGAVYGLAGMLKAGDVAAAAARGAVRGAKNGAAAASGGTSGRSSASRPSSRSARSTQSSRSARSTQSSRSARSTASRSGGSRAAGSGGTAKPRSSQSRSRRRTSGGGSSSGGSSSGGGSSSS